MTSTIAETGHTVTSERFRSVRSLTEDLAAPLSPEDQTVQSMPDVSPTKWHRAHTSWFFETFILQPYGQGYKCFNPRYSFLFNSYYEAVGGRYPRPDRGLISRPGTAEIGDYRRHVDEAIVSLLSAGEPEAAVGGLIELGLHHEQQHQELILMDIKHVLAQNPAYPTYRDVPVPAGTPSPPLSWTAFEGGMAEIGHGSDEFAFDNESPRHGVYLEPFAMADRPVTCGDWAEFIADGGYERASSGSRTAGPGSGTGPCGSRFTGKRRALVGGSSPRRPRSGQPRRASHAHQLLRGRRLRPLGGGAPADRGGVGVRCSSLRG